MKLYDKSSKNLIGKLKVVWFSSFTSLLLCLVFDFVGGTFLGVYFEKIMVSYPLILVILPGLMGLRGNIFGAMASRFTTALYMGEMEPKLTDENVIRGILISVLLSIIPILILWTAGVIRLDNLSSSVLILLIVISSTILVSLLLGFSTAVVTIEPFKRDLDPDMIAAPLVTTISDVLTIPMLIAFVLFYEINYFAFYLSSMLLISAVLVFFAKIRFRSRDRRIFFEILGVLTVLAVVESITGNILEYHSKIVYTSAIFSIIYPAILDSLGNYGAIVASKTSTNLHLGAIKGFLDRDILLEVFSLFTTSFFIAFFMNLIGVLITLKLANKYVGILIPFIITFPVVTVLVMLLASAFAVIFHRFNLDPDNVTVPVITTVADLIGTVFTVSMAKLI